MTKPHLEIDPEVDLIHKKKALEELAEQRMQNAVEEPTEQEKALYEQAFAQAPLKLRVLIEDMIKGKEYTKRYRAILLAGPTGTGKSTLARAIAYKLGLECDIINAPSLLGHYRDLAAERVREMFDRFREDMQKKVRILEEINALTDDHNSEHSDTKHTAMQLWTLLDEFKDDKNFFMIATANITKKMPHQLQSRFKGRTFFIDNLTEASCRQALECCIKKLGVARDETCTDVYLSELAKKTTNFSPRDIETLIDTAVILFSAENRNIPVEKLSKACLEKAYEEIVEENKKFWDFTAYATEEERRHRETLAQNKTQFEENKEVQIRLAELNLYWQGISHNTPKYAPRKQLRNVEAYSNILFPNRNKGGWKASETVTGGGDD